MAGAPAKRARLSAAANLGRALETLNTRRSGDAEDGRAGTRRTDGVAEGWTGVGLTADEVARFSRPCLVTSFGPRRQLSLCRASALVVGVGGLGTPAATYLAASGVGMLGLCDHDVVDASNLHRQPLFDVASVGKPKVECAVERLRQAVEPRAVRVHDDNACELSDGAPCQCATTPGVFALRTHRAGLTRENARATVRAYDVVLDCTDNPRTRYLLNDACVLEGKPLIYGASVGTEGQLTVYNHCGGPCLRCVFPEPADPNACDVCSDTGVLGFVPGIIGVMQAQEAIKVVTGFGRTLSGRMLHYDAEDCRQFMAKLRGRRPECAACGLEATVSSQFSMPHDDAAVTCAKPPPSYPNRWTPARLAKALGEGSGERVVLLDVRSDNQHAMCALHGSVSVPYETSLADAEALAARAPDLEAAAAAAAAEAREDGQALHIVCYCRRGNDSQLAAARLEPLLHAHASVVDLEGGLNAWRRDVDEAFPVY